jgi:predicted peptidase
MTTVYAQNGGRVAHAQWEGTWSQHQFSDAVAKLKAEDANIRYVSLKKGTVVPPGQKDDGGSNHVNTWRIAYDIPGIRDWLFEQHK